MARQPKGTGPKQKKGKEGDRDQIFRPVLTDAGSMDSDPTDRRADRALACTGLLQEAAPLFGDTEQVPGGGVLLALPLVAGSNILQSFSNVYRRLRPGWRIRG